MLRFFRKFRILIRREKFHDELEEEMAFHREQAEKDLQASGMSTEDAHYAGLRQFGNATRLKEESLDAVRFSFETALQDLRYAARQLRKNPGFAVTAILVLALGIGASTAIFSAVNSILFEPLPYPDADRAISIWDFGSPSIAGANSSSRLQVTFGTYRELTERSRSFQALAVLKPWQPTFSGGTQPERFEGERVSAAYFRVLGISPVIGRDFQVSDDEVNGPQVAILSDGLWRRRFGANAGIIGQPVRLGDTLYTVVGVMPRGFENMLAPAAELWAPLQYDKSLAPDSREWGHHLRMIGRLRAGVTVAQARQEFDVIAHHPIPEFHRPAYASLDRGLLVSSLQDDLTSDVRPALMAIFGAVILVLLIACVNVTNLQLARGAQRRGEFALRAALGAARARIIRQLVTESLLLAAVGAGFGIALAEFGVRALVALSPAELPRANAIRVDGAVFAFALGITALIGLVVGLVPALNASRAQLHTTMQQSSQRIAGHQWTRRTLVISEVALALVLLISAGLLFRSLERLFAIDPGFDPSHLLTMQVQTSALGPGQERTERFFTQALEAVRRVPGVQAAAFTSQLPLSGDMEDGYGVHFDSSPTGNLEADNGGLRYAVSPGYFETMAIPLRRGRLLNEHDIAGAPLAAVISESLAKSKYPGEDAIGHRLRVGPNEGPWFTIVGIAGNVKQASLAVSQTDAVYITSAQWRMFVDKARWLVVRGRDDVAALTPAIQRAVWSADKDQPIVRVATMDSLLAASAAERHFVLVLFEWFALAALVLAATGIYGVLAGTVAERTREIGVRAALGAARGDILGLVMRQGMTLAAIGALIGLGGAAVASRALITLLFGISRIDPVTYIGVIALLLSVCGVACWVPALRAARVDPAITLRAE